MWLQVKRCCQDSLTNKVSIQNHNTITFMDIGKTLYISEVKDWHEWLKSNFNTAKEIWLIYPDKDTNKPRIQYNDAVEEALSFGWIDSIVKRNDEHSSAQRFSPRNPDSEYSQSNKERLQRLAKEGRLHPSIKESVEKTLKTQFVFPPDILKAIKSNQKAWENYQNFSAAYRRIRVAYINGARDRPEEFKKRLSNFIKKTEQNKQIGFGGIEKYY
jgi:uncharacterized protein YdeI (YjbR/CyaY-like superfamily)